MATGQYRKRQELLKLINERTEKPLIFLSFAWIGLVIYEFVYGLSSRLEIAIYVLWVIFIADFFIEFAIAPEKQKYLKENILTLFSLFIPAFRVFRIFRIARGLRALRTLRTIGLARILASINRSINTLRESLKGRGIEYLTILTAIIVFAGSAGIYYFENTDALSTNGNELRQGPVIETYGDALWFTSMIIVTIGSDYWPKSPEGRILTFFISLYAFAVFGYITATIASIILGKKNEDSNG